MESKLYESIEEVAKKNNFDSVFFDLNPLNRSKHSHRFAKYVADRVGLEEDVDYEYLKKNVGTKENPTHRKQTMFKLKNPEWKKITIKRDGGLEGKLFLESILQKPGVIPEKPDLVYDEGYVAGYLLEL
jgi:hypothetical protein